MAFHHQVRHALYRKTFQQVVLFSAAKPVWETPYLDIVETQLPK